MEEETIKQITNRDILNSFHNHWLEKKLQLEIELEILDKPIIFTKNVGQDAQDNTKQKANCEAGIKMAEERLKVIKEKSK